ncbi:MAG: GntR family transcriptional regulator [Aeromicrobium sp.]|uniref:GntR family transcriptional regulator n=1 Tax=Aeromicrobium sp. TaxID=1871063 RepID=UPI0039E4FBD7
MSGPSGRRTAADEVFTQLRERIVTGELVPGARQSIYRLSDELGVSRTPVREAVVRLADLGLVSVERNRGIVVQGVRAEDVRDVFELRLLLEVPAAAGAAERADADLVRRLREALAAMRAAAEAADDAAFTRHDRELHAALGAALGNARLSGVVDRLRDSIQAHGVSTIDRTRSMTMIAEEHAPIVEAVAARDPVAAAGAMREHLERTAALLLEQLGHGAVPLRDLGAVGEASCSRDPSDSVLGRQGE